MLHLSNIVKNYVLGDTVVHALKNINIVFRRNEFVSILGPSGCGKTTLLNIVSGLDRYTSGDLVINGTSTKQYKDKNWDSYRNHSIGFVFQSYNLIPHQSVLGNVELALTLSGVSVSVRKAMAIDALEKVGLGDQLHKKPNQLSGGQMQRVAIARSLVNNPDVILADEPTGALDTETSVQILDLLKEVAKEKLVIMVTHNPDLAKSYSTRTIRLIDGEIVSDSMPYTLEEEQVEIGKYKALESQVIADKLALEKTQKTAIKNKDNLEAALIQTNAIENDEITNIKTINKRLMRKNRTKMSFATAFSLSLRNLFTKKARTFLTAFAGSIGIIGIALILSLSNGFQNYINRIERETLSAYPIQIFETSYATDAIMNAMMIKPNNGKAYPEDEKVYSNNVLANMLKGLSSGISKNDLTSFKFWLEANPQKTEGISNDIQYVYPTNFCIYSNDYSVAKNQQLYPFSLPSSMEDIFGGQSDNIASKYMQSMMDEMPIWQEMINNQEVLDEQYDVINGNWPKTYQDTDNGVFEVVLVVDKYNRVNDYLLCAIGLSSLESVFINFNTDTSVANFDFESLLETKYKVLLQAEKYNKKSDTNVWEDKSDVKTFMKSALDEAITLQIAGIVRPKEGSNASLLTGAIAYNQDLTNYIINKTNNKDIVIEQKANPEINVFTGAEFDNESEGSFKTLEKSCEELGIVDINTPSAIFMYASGFEQKEKLNDLIKEYNSTVDEDMQIKYSDMVALLMGSVSTIINAVSYVLIAFISISLIVSSIMIGIITYISVLERTKEIGVLRSIGASKRDISRLFNAETISVGFMSGLFGIFVTILLNIPINLIIKALTDLSGIARLPLSGAIALVSISVILSWIAGFVPSKIAAKKDPIVALRTE